MPIIDEYIAILNAQSTLPDQPPQTPAKPTTEPPPTPFATRPRRRPTFLPPQPTYLDQEDTITPPPAPNDTVVIPPTPTPTPTPPPKPTYGQPPNTEYFGLPQLKEPPLPSADPHINHKPKPTPPPPKPPKPKPTDAQLLKKALLDPNNIVVLCQQLNALGLVGCATTRRLKAMAAQFRLPKDRFTNIIKGLAKRCKPPADPCSDPNITTAPDPETIPLNLLTPEFRRWNKWLRGQGDGDGKRGKGDGAPQAHQCPRPPGPKTRLNCHVSERMMKELGIQLFNYSINKNTIFRPALEWELHVISHAMCDSEIQQCPGFRSNLITLKRRLNLYIERTRGQLTLGPYLDTINNVINKLSGRPPTYVPPTRPRRPPKSRRR